MARPSRTGRRAWWSVLGGALRFVGRVVRGLIAVAVLVALVAGLPWALWHYIGWPLPDHVPTWAEVESVLLGPMTTTFLLDFLACLCWLVWAAFVLDVVRCAAQAVRDGVRAAHWPQISAREPVHALAAVLISAILLSILGSRASAPPTSPLSTPAAAGSMVVATAPAWSTTPDVSTVGVQRAALVTQQERSASPAASQRAQSVVVRARDPETGVYDSLSRIAERALGTQARWPEIFELNKGKPQPNGKPFTNPHLIFPGEELRLPADAQAAPVTPPEPPPQPPPPPQQPPPEQSTPAPTTSPPSTTATPPSPSVPSTQPAAGAPAGRSVSDEPAISWGPELFVGLGLAAAVSAALMVARRRHRRGYQPGSGRRDDLDLPVAPVVYQLRLAHLRAEQGDDLEDTASREDDRRVRPSPAVVIGADVSGSGPTASITPGLGVRDGREIALDLAVARGLGLIGAGAPAAARALLVTALTSATTPADNAAMSAGTSVLVPADDLPLLLGHGTPRAHLPQSLRVLASLDEALHELEADILRRAREEDSGPWPVVVLVARPPQHNHQRLQAVLDNGAPFGIVGVVLGQWQAGVTAYIREDGTVSATGPGLGEAMRGTRMFRVGADEATDLLDLLRRAQPETPSPDAMVGSRVPGPRTVAMERADEDAIVRDPAPHGVGGDGVVVSDAVLAADTELEVTAVASPVDRSDAGLEILETRTGPPPGARRRTAAITTQLPTSTSSDAHVHEAAATDQAHSTEAAEPGDTARAAEVDRASVRIRLTVLGQPRLHWRPQAGNTEADITGAFQPRLRELLVFLGLHPDGATRESLIGALWGHSPPEKTTSALNTALSRLRGAFSKATDGALTDIIITGEGSYRLDPTVVDVDYWQFDLAVARRRAATTPHERIDAYRDIVNSYTGPLADGMSTDWIESAREAIRRDALDAVAALARALVDDDPEQTLDLLEMARAFDPHNELLYRDIMRLQERLGRLDAIPRTLTLLTTRLAELDDRPTPQAIDLAARLRQRHETTPTAAAGPPRRDERDPPGRGRSAAS